MKSETLSAIQELRESVRRELAPVLINLEEQIDQLLIALLARGHCLLEGVPGIAKTLLAKSFARAIGFDFNRIQFTPDLLPSDITGTYIFDRNKSDFVLRKGPIFTRLLLADEINRSPSKTQSALLEAMQEEQVTIEGETLLLPRPFLVLATQNPVEQEGVYRLPEAQLDRFFLRINFPYPGIDAEMQILRTHQHAPVEPSAVSSPQAIADFQVEVEETGVRDGVLHTISLLAMRTRRHTDLFLGMSPRASLNLLFAARTRACLEGRPYVTHDDFKAMVKPVLAHRLMLRPEAEIEGRTTDSVLEEILHDLPLWQDEEDR